MADIDMLFEELLARRGSDLHMLQGEPPRIRVNGHLEAIPGTVMLDGPVTEGLMRGICPEAAWAKFERTGDADFAYGLGQRARFRANYKRHIGGLGAVFRLVPNEVIPLEKLGVPTALKSFKDVRAGLCLVTGATGSGKSTTLAAVIHEINQSHRRMIVTIEEPIEFVHQSKFSTIVQREVGIDVPSFVDGLRGALRADADVIMVGEMRDLETMQLAVTAAEMGSLVFGTLHTNTAVKAVDRIIDMFPADQQMPVRSALAASMRAVCAQILMRRADGAGRVAAHEVLIQTPAVSNLIRESKTNQIPQVMMSSRAIGMQVMDDAIQALLDQGIVEGEEAYMKSVDKERFQKFAPIREGR